jgi:hypothetical protein
VLSSAQAGLAHVCRVGRHQGAADDPTKYARLQVARRTAQHMAMRRGKRRIDLSGALGWMRRACLRLAIPSATTARATGCSMLRAAAVGLAKAEHCITRAG